jgi:hypothetical protein
MNRAEGRVVKIQKGGNMEAIMSRFGVTALKRAVLLGIFGAMLIGFMVVNTVSTGTIGPSSGAIKLSSQAFSDDSDITVTSNGIKVVPTTDGTDDLKIEVYGDNGSTTTLIATFYVEQGTADVGLIEGVTGTVDLGSYSSVYDTIDVVVTHQ